MRAAIDHHIAILNPEYRPPVTLADPIGSRLATQRRDAEMQRVRRERYSFQTLQEPPRICPWQGGELFEDPRGNDQRHIPNVFALR